MCKLLLLQTVKTNAGRFSQAYWECRKSQNRKTCENAAVYGFGTAHMNCMSAYRKHFSPATKAHPAFAVDSISELREKLNKHEIDIKEGEPLEGAERFYIHDPFGNRLEFLERQD